MRVRICKLSQPVGIGDRFPTTDQGSPPLQLLLVEDDPLIARDLAEKLGVLGHQCRHCVTGAEASGVFTQGMFDAIILDRMLPDITGTGLLQLLRAQGPLPPVLMLSALGSANDKVEGLNAGADDYLAKPYNVGELNARLAALVRRGPHVQGDVISLSIGQLRLDGATHKVRFGAEHGHLNRIEFSLLLFLMRHADRLVTRAMLFEGVWTHSFQPAPNLVDSNISRLRRRLLDLGCDPIATRRGEGYVLLTDQCL
ncbi:response regulator transcription factor [Sphingomonas abietis]|uniref:Response regulator transcription factor n=1 Tax=Sphingomonas abietis TaxID=3012344 RepID=A0ABY7NGM0_9SPHN|nr:response regulator transcription factor [Sphingomonas abietis]WBO20695.1 response regulator transcription factor [Sphingomonas abietis]